MKSQSVVGILVVSALAFVAEASFQARNGFLSDAVHQLKMPGDEEPLLIPQVGLLAHSANVTSHKVFEARDPVVEWPAESSTPKIVQWILAGLWVAMLASMPLALPFVEGKESTKTQKTIGATMLVVLFGGFYLFTNIILFQSVHFKTIRPLTMVECIYFMAQVITTVGYGDVTPAKVRGQVFVGFYVLGALFVISMVISDLTTHTVAKAKAYKEARAIEAGTVVCAGPKHLRTLLAPEKPSAQNLINSLLVFAVLDIMWIIFFSSYPGEGKTVFQAIYMSVITLSTVGFGWFTPVTEGGMIFGAFMMLFGAGALGSVICNFTDFTCAMNEWEHAVNAHEETTAESMAMLKTLNNGGQEVTAAQFLRFTLMHTKRVEKGHLDEILEVFENMKPQKGKVALKAVEQSMEGVEDDKTK